MAEALSTVEQQNLVLEDSTVYHVPQSSERYSTDDDDEVRQQFDLHMKWQRLLSPLRFVGRGRTETPSSTQTRTVHQKDFDKVTFSAAFHRLANKTQVFPLVKNDSVHNRLTHSLEVSAVGGCLARSVADDMKKLGIFESTRNLQEENQRMRDVEDVVKTACLLHDIGNPPFGHSGEHALREWWKRWKPPSEYSVSSEWNERYSGDKIFKDFHYFEGNATGFRIIMKKIPKLTHASIAAFVKYPRSSLSEDSCWKKNGLYIDNLFDYAKIAKNCGLSQKNMVWQRHPLTYLMEAADDICYNVVDLEDAVRMNVLPEAQAREALLDLLCEDATEMPNLTPIDQLRSDAINMLVDEAVARYSSYFSDICEGKYHNTLIQRKDEKWAKVKDYSYNIVYRAKSVIEIEVAGCRILKYLMMTFVEAVLLNLVKASVEAEHLFLLLPDQVQAEITDMYKSYQTVIDSTPHDLSIEQIIEQISSGITLHDGLDPIAIMLVQQRYTPEVTKELYIIYKVVLIISDYISGMTDRYATNMYKKLRGHTL